MKMSQKREKVRKGKQGGKKTKHEIVCGDFILFQFLKQLNHQ